MRPSFALTLEERSSSQWYLTSSGGLSPNILTGPGSLCSFLWTMTKKGGWFVCFGFGFLVFKCRFLYLLYTAFLMALKNQVETIFVTWLLNFQTLIRAHPGKVQRLALLGWELSTWRRQGRGVGGGGGIWCSHILDDPVPAPQELHQLTQGGLLLAINSSGRWQSFDWVVREALEAILRLTVLLLNNPSALRAQAGYYALGTPS